MPAMWKRHASPPDCVPQCHVKQKYGVQRTAVRCIKYYYFIHSVLWQPVCDIYRNGTKLQILECILDPVAVARKIFWCPFLELSLIHCCPLLSLSSRCLESCWRGSRARSAGQRSRTWCCWTGTGPGSAWWTWWAFCNVKMCWAELLLTYLSREPRWPLLAAQVYISQCQPCCFPLPKCFSLSLKIEIWNLQ